MVLAKRRKLEQEKKHRCWQFQYFLSVPFHSLYDIVYVTNTVWLRKIILTLKVHTATTKKWYTTTGRERKWQKWNALLWKRQLKIKESIASLSLVWSSFFLSLKEYENSLFHQCLCTFLVCLSYVFFAHFFAASLHCCWFYAWAAITKTTSIKYSDKRINDFCMFILRCWLTISRPFFCFLGSLLLLRCCCYCFLLVASTAQTHTFSLSQSVCTRDEIDTLYLTSIISPAAASQRTVEQRDRHLFIDVSNGKSNIKLTRDSKTHFQWLCDDNVDDDGADATLVFFQPERYWCALWANTEKCNVRTKHKNSSHLSFVSF